MASQKRKQFSLQEKIAIINDVEKGLKKGEAARKYGIAPSTLSTFLKDKKKIEEQLESSTLGPQRKRMRTAQHQDVDAAVFQWFQEARSRNIPINGPLLREKACQLATMLGVEHFQGSVGWMNRFRDRYGVVAKTICGEANDAPLQPISDWRHGEVADLIKEYTPENVYNADEAGIFFQLEPRKTLAYKGDKCIGGKSSKQRITALFCCNQAGSDKRKILIIGKSAKPRCFKNCHSLPCEYTSNKKAWMTREIFSNWLRKFNKDMKKQNKKVLLLIDNCTAHNELPKLDFVRVKFFPPNCTSVLQPLDQGIIKAVKSHYRSMLLRHMLLSIENGGEKKPNVKEAIDMISGSWNSIRQKTIVNCWNHARLTDEETNRGLSDDREIEPVTEQIRDLWKAITKTTTVPDDVTLEDFISADDDLEVCSKLTDQEIVDSIKNAQQCDSNESDSDESENVDLSTVTASEAIAHLSKIKNFISSTKDVPDIIFSNVHLIENFLMSSATNSVVQKKITDFFA